ncbi:hypothetical protein K7X08_036017 [Anisodus acutangulus]|uniref:YdbS-like PH domain-containing protein n=1 Tax=Anisodus acutangulus TaxID=402998 RepID=A0A9Q1QXN5_9SOLA|nr:hypothetical protein K7X08_036017 [Anisodus acutangulus]
MEAGEKDAWNVQLSCRFTNLRVTVISGLTGQDRSDFLYKVIRDVQVVPRFIGEWGDVIITLKDGTVVDLRSVPKFREIAKLTGQDRSDFLYKVIKDVQVVPRFIGEWGDVIITLKDGTVVDFRSVPKFREIAKYCLSMADKDSSSGVLKESTDDGPKGF